MEALVGRIATEHLGETVGGLVDVMKSLPPLSLKQLRSHSILSLLQIKTALSVLQQHHLVQARNGLFSLLPKSIHARLRFPLYIQLAQNEHLAGNEMRIALEQGEFELQSLLTLGGNQGNVNALIQSGYITSIDTQNIELKRNSSLNDNIRKKPKLMKNASETEKCEKNAYMVNWELMDSRLIQRKIIALVATEAGERAALLISAIWSVPRPLTIPEITAFLPSVLSFSSEEVEHILTVIKPYIQLHEGYSVDKTALMDRLRAVTAQKLIANLLGEYAGRVVVLLQHQVRLSETELGNMALLPSREAGEIVEKMAGMGVIRQVSQHWELHPALYAELSTQLVNTQDSQMQWLVLSTQSCH